MGTATARARVPTALPEPDAIKILQTLDKLVACSRGKLVVGSVVTTEYEIEDNGRGWVFPAQSHANAC